MTLSAMCFEDELRLDAGALGTKPLGAEVNRGRIAIALVAASMFAAAHCGGGDATGPSKPVALVRAGGEGQSGTVGLPLASALRVRVTDAGGAGVAGVEVTWAVSSGGGSLASPTSTTNGAGEASVAWTLGAPAGIQGVTASAAALPAVTFSATAAPGAAAALSFVVQPADVTAGTVFSPALQVAVHDSYGNTVAVASPSITISLGANPASGTLSGTTTVAAVSGVATFSDLKIDRSGGGYTLAASATGLTSATSVVLSVAAGAASALAFSVHPANAVAGATLGPAVRVSVQDALGNTVTGSSASVTVAITSGTGGAGATLGGTLSKAAVGGVATFGDLSVDKVASGYTLTATSSGLSSATSGAFAVSPGPATKLAFSVQPSAVTAGAAMSPSVRVVVQDAYGNTVTGSTASVTLAITAGTGTAGATLGGTVTRSAVAGLASFDDLRVVTTGSGYTLSAAVNGLSPATSGAFSVSAAAPVKLAFSVQPGPLNLGSSLAASVAVLVQDTFGNTATGSSADVTVAVASGTGTAGAVLGGTLTRATVGGLATFGDLTMDRTGSGYALTATSAGLSADTSAAFDVAVIDSVVASGAFTCALSDSGTAYCWGDNYNGQLGNGSWVETGPPAAVAGGHAFTSITAGGDQACGLVADGSVYCWGRNTWGGLGDGTTTNRAAPVRVSHGPPFAQVSTGFGHTCALTAAGAAYCWGYNSDGQLGNGLSEWVNGPAADTTAPVAVLGGLTFASVSAGSHTCGLTVSDAAYCWGNNYSGQLGDSSTTGRSVPVAVAGGRVFSRVDADGIFTCALTPSGAAFCWGAGMNGELGDGTGLDQHVPTPVTGGRTFTSVGVGEYGACGLTTSGAAYCWGLGGSGQLGDGLSTDSPTPVAVSGGFAFTTVSTSGYHACGVTTAGDVYCWGFNGSGQLGNSSTVNSPVPSRVH